MLIINADDWGRSRQETDAALACHKAGSITSTSAMVFMEDSERAADIAKDCGIDVGLHLNLSQRYNGRSPLPAAAKAHDRVVRFMSAGKYTVLLYHPGLRREFRDVYQSQFDEFVRLYGNPPSHLDGHQHKHLCLNILLQRILPEGQRVRRSFSFSPGEKGPFNRAYRRWVDRRLAARHRLTDYFFSLSQQWQWGQLPRVCQLAQSTSVELMVHPALPEEHALLLGEQCRTILQQTAAAA